MDEVVAAVMRHLMRSIQPVDKLLSETLYKSGFILLRHRSRLCTMLCRTGITRFALAIGVTLFKAQFRETADRFEVAAVPLAAMQIGRIGFAATDAGLVMVSKADELVEGLLGLLLEVTVGLEG